MRPPSYSPIPLRSFSVFSMLRSDRSRCLDGGRWGGVASVLIWFVRGARWPTVGSLLSSGCLPRGTFNDGADGDNAEEEGPPARSGGEYRASHHERACRELVGSPT